MDELIVKLDKMDMKLDEIQKELREIKKDTSDVAQFTPFVESLSKMGTLGTLTKLGNVLHYINPMSYVANDDTRTTENEEGGKEENSLYDIV